MVPSLLTCRQGQGAMLQRRSPVSTSLSQLQPLRSALLSDPGLTLGHDGSKKSSVVFVDFSKRCKICLQRTLSSPQTGGSSVLEPLTFA